MMQGLPPAPPAYVAVARTAAWRMIPAFTVIAVQLTETIDSAKAKTGEVFHFQTLEPVAVHGKTVLPARTSGIGIVADAQPAGPHSRPGALLLEARYLRLPGGGECQVTVDRKISDLREHGVSPTLPFYTSYLPIPDIGLIAKAYDYVRNGRDVVLPTGTVFIVVTLERAVFPAAPSPHRPVPPTS